MQSGRREQAAGGRRQSLSATGLHSTAQAARFSMRRWFCPASQPPGCTAGGARRRRHAPSPWRPLVLRLLVEWLFTSGSLTLGLPMRAALPDEPALSLPSALAHLQPRRNVKRGRCRRAEGLWAQQQLPMLRLGSLGVPCAPCRALLHCPLLF